MNFTFTVHSCDVQSFPIQVPYGDKTVDAQVAGLVVELVADGMSQTLKFIPDDLDAAKAEFAVGASIVASYAGAA